MQSTYDILKSAARSASARIVRFKRWQRQAQPRAVYRMRYGR